MCISELLRINYWKPQQQYKGSTESASIERTNRSRLKPSSFPALHRADLGRTPETKSKWPLPFGGTLAQGETGRIPSASRHIYQYSI